MGSTSPKNPRVGDAAAALLTIRRLPNCFLAAVHDPIDHFETLHDRVVHVADLVPPRSKSPARIDAPGLKARLQLVRNGVLIPPGYGIAVLHGDAIAGNDPEGVRLVQERGGEESLQGLLDNSRRREARSTPVASRVRYLAHLGLPRQ